MLKDELVIENIDLRSDCKISLALMSSFIILQIQYLIIIFFNLSGTHIASMVGLASKLSVGAIYILALPSVLKRNKWNFVQIYILATSIFILSYVIFPENRLFLRGLIFPIFFMNLPSLIYIMSIVDLKVFRNIMKKSCYFVFVIGILLSVLLFSGKVKMDIYNRMTFSYYMLFPTIIFLDELFDKFSTKAFIVAGLSFVVILSIGSRGAVLCILVFVFLKYIKRNYEKIWLNISILVVGVFCLDGILQFLNNVFLRYGIRSLTIARFLEKGVDLTGRDSLLKLVIAEIKNKPIFGIGIAGDRSVLDGAYVHNILIEILSNFGMILGSMILMVLFILIIKSLFTKNMAEYGLVVVWISLGFVSLMVSDSYLENIRFWIFLGLLININGTVRRRQKILTDRRRQMILNAK